MSDDKENEMLREIDAPDADAGEEAMPSIEDKYASQMREISTQKVELPMSSLTDMLDPRAGQITLNPEFQRREIWDIVRKSRFIESIIMNIPLPPIFLGEVDYGQWVVLDGRQRLTAIYEFKRNTYSLKGLKVWKELNGKDFVALEKEGLDKFLLRQFIPAVTVKKESSPQVKYDVFDRLNTGGVVALPMEIRNAIYQGGFNKALHTLSKTTDFLFLWSLPAEGPARERNPFFNRMYDLEQVLRFFAVPEYQGKMKFKDYLGEFMGERNKLYATDKDQEERDRVRFERAHRAVRRVFDGSAFHRPLPNGEYSTTKSSPLADAVLAALSEIPLDQLTEERSARIKLSLEQLSLTNAEFQRATTSGTNGKGAIDTRLRLAREVVAQAMK